MESPLDTILAVILNQNKNRYLCINNIIFCLLLQIIQNAGRENGNDLKTRVLSPLSGGPTTAHGK
jgi:hypothetical protein